MDCPLLANGIAALAAFAAAWLWWRSTVVEVLQDNTPDKDGWISGGLFKDGPNGLIDTVATQDEANRINRKAALAAALAALAQGIALLLPVITKWFL